MSNISVVITSFQDTRVFHLVDELLKQNPKEVIIADGGSDTEMLEKFSKMQSETVKFYLLPGNIAETRFQVQRLINGEITVFVDTDELPTEKWLPLLTAPIEKGICEFTFGSTKPLIAPNNLYSRYLTNYDEFLYTKILSNDIMKGALGNSAWKTEIIKKIGFDPCLGIGGEDYDLTIRAIQSGYRGFYVKDAILFHDQNGIRTLRKFLKKMFYNYMVGASIAYRKNGILFGRVGKSATSNIKFKDPFEILMFLIKPFAFIFSLMLNPWEDPRLCKAEFKKRI